MDSRKKQKVNRFVCYGCKIKLETVSKETIVQCPQCDFRYYVKEGVWDSIGEESLEEIQKRGYA